MGVYDGQSGRDAYGFPARSSSHRLSMGSEDAVTMPPDELA